MREDGTPYYSGKGKGRRAWEKSHNVNLPADQSRIVITHWGLTELWAFAIERRHIRWYGRKDNETGILRNLTDGGEGSEGSVPWNKGGTHKPESCKLMSEKATGRKQSAETIANRIAKNTGKKRTSEQRKRLGRKKGSPLSAEHKLALSGPRGKMTFVPSEDNSNFGHWHITNIHTGDIEVVIGLRPWAKKLGLNPNSVFSKVRRLGKFEHYLIKKVN